MRDEPTPEVDQDGSCGRIADQRQQPENQGQQPHQQLTSCPNRAAPVGGDWPPQKHSGY